MSDGPGEVPVEVWRGGAEFLDSLLNKILEKNGSVFGASGVRRPILTVCNCIRDITKWSGTMMNRCSILVFCFTMLVFSSFSRICYRLVLNFTDSAGLLRHESSFQSKTVC